MAAHAMNKVPGVFAAALLRRPFVTLLNSMTDPSLPMTAHEYDEWGDPGDADVVRLLASLSPHKHIHKTACVSTTSAYAAFLFRQKRQFAVNAFTPSLQI